MKKRYWISALIVLFTAWMLYPRPSTGRLLRWAPVLEGRMNGLLGSASVGFMDPSFYYRFSVEPATLQLAIDELELRPSKLQDYSIEIMQGSHGPVFWHRWW